MTAGLYRSGDKEREELSSARYCRVVKTDYVGLRRYIGNLGEIFEIDESVWAGGEYDRFFLTMPDKEERMFFRHEIFEIETSGTFKVVELTDSRLLKLTDHKRYIGQAGELIQVFPDFENPLKDLFLLEMQDGTKRVFERCEILDLREPECLKMPEDCFKRLTQVSV